MALTLIKGNKVNLWVRNMLNALRRLHLQCETTLNRNFEPNLWTPQGTKG